MVLVVDSVEIFEDTIAETTFETVKPAVKNADRFEILADGNKLDSLYKNGIISAAAADACKW